jgi:hypothetical protein
MQHELGPCGHERLGKDLWSQVRADGEREELQHVAFASVLNVVVV